MNKQNRRTGGLGISTIAVHAGEKDDCAVRPVNPPIYQSNAYSFETSAEGEEAFASKYDSFIYTRLGNPTIRALEDKAAALEGAESSLAAASGMGAISAAVMGLLGGQGHAISFSTIYGGSFRLFNDVLVPFGITTTFISPAEQDTIEKHIRPDTRIVYMESPMNPSMELIDIEMIAGIARENNLLTVFDNTFSTPCCQQPLEMAVDVVLHSASKYLCGHGDALGGIAAGKKEAIAAIRDKALSTLGGVISPFNAWLILRGIQTLPLRMKRHCENADALAGFLQQHPRVMRVNYPGLPSFPQAELAAKQMNGAGGVLSFELENAAAARGFLDKLELCTISGSLGDSKTLIIHPASMSHRGFSQEMREKAGVTDGLVRVAVGLEDHADIIADIKQALDAC